MPKKTRQPIYVLGLNEAHCASAALFRDGNVVAAANEERFTRIKNRWGFPKQAINFVCETAGINRNEIDLVALSYTDPYPHFVTDQAVENNLFAPPWLRKLRDIAPQAEYAFPTISILTDIGRRAYYQLLEPKNRKRQILDISNYVHVNPAQIKHFDHHLVHAASAYFAAATNSKHTVLIVTADGAGDQMSAKVFVGFNNSLTQIAATPHMYSLGLLYTAVTSYLGLKAHEDEYKIMGLAPYAQSADVSKIFTIFANVFWVEGLEFKSKIPSRQYGLFLKQKLGGFRFDHLATAIQLFFEKSLTQWITNAIQQTHISTVYCSGGVFLNVKANQQVAKIPILKKLYVLPSPGDESTVFGAGYLGYKLVCGEKQVSFLPQPLHSLYLGNLNTDEEIHQHLKRIPGIKYQKPKNISLTIATLLASGKIVARCVGSAEFGARALGNRSILADPRNLETIYTLNKMIKKRDFWMPFAATILAEKASLYIKNSPKIIAPLMTMAFDTTKRAHAELRAAVHPYDKTIRPHLLTKDMNPEYFEILKAFATQTGVSALLNTSFNLHGEPIVNTPEDALSTFKRSGLNYLQLGNYLVWKISS